MAGMHRWILVAAAVLAAACSRRELALDAGALDAGALDAGDGGMGGGALRFFGGLAPAGELQVHRVRIPLDEPPVPADIGATSSTIEVWLKTTTAGQGACTSLVDAWINGRIFIDQDVFGPGDLGDYGLALFAGGQVGYGVAVGGSGATVCGTTSIADGQWHHVAVTRDVASGELNLFIDGTLDGTVIGVAGDASYANGRDGSEADRYLTLGGEKHALEGYPYYEGGMDELRLSRGERYAAAFARPTAPFEVDGDTAALYHFDEGEGTEVRDAVGQSDGFILRGGSPLGPERTGDTPFAAR